MDNNPNSEGDSKKVYHLVPELILSRSDGDPHFISAPSLAALYRLKPTEWTTCPGAHGGVCPNRETVHLGPRYDGDYRRPESYED
jgi:hypothetical protein